jgi:pimeloyl-ACP methyl ester carboxylesterase
LSDITHRDIEVNGVTLHVAEAGSGPMVLLLHGFPECWYSWRHQLTALSEAGYHVVAPDQRGYGSSDAPAAVEEYDIFHLTDDAVALVDAMGAERAVVVGHDWGAIVAWHCALLHPDRFSAVIAMSVPYGGRAEFAPVPAMRAMFGEDFYVVRFQPPGVVDAELAADVRASMRGALVGGAGEGDPLPDWISEAEIDVFVESFERSGFTGGINWYRNLDRNWEGTPQLAGAKVEQPALFLIGEQDLPFLTAGAKSPEFAERVPNLEEIAWLKDCGHWIQQERAADVSERMISFLAKVTG